MTSLTRQPLAVVTLVCGDVVLPVWTINGTTDCDLDLVERLLRLRLRAVRAGARLLLTVNDDELLELLGLLGMSHLFPTATSECARQPPVW